MSHRSAVNETEHAVLFFREDPSFRTECSRTFSLGSGHMRTELYKRLTGIKYDSETNNHFTYSCGANGQAVKVTDSVLSRSAISEYDLALCPAQISAGKEIYIFTPGRWDMTGTITSAHSGSRSGAEGRCITRRSATTARNG